MNDDNGEFPFVETMGPAKKKKKADIVALQSDFKRCLPALDIAVARDLLDCGFQHVDELRGRSPEVLSEKIRKLRPQTPADHLASLRMIIYYAETPEPDRKKLQPHVWA